MSKSKGNVVNPDSIIEQYGADTLRLYILFIGDYEQSTPWNDSGVKGARRFLEKLVRLEEKVTDKANDSYQVLLHKTIKAVDEDIENVKFNTAIAKLMTLVNELGKANHINKTDFETVLKLVNPFAPHITEELWEKLGHTEDMVYAQWPKHDETKLVESTIEMVVSINGKVRDKITVNIDTSKEDIIELAKSRDKIKELIDGKEIRKIIVVPKKLVNIVV
jgi:leucyl-tRNA synthetase